MFTVDQVIAALDGLNSKTCHYTDRLLFNTGFPYQVNETHFSPIQQSQIVTSDLCEPKTSCILNYHSIFDLWIYLDGLTYVSTWILLCRKMYYNFTILSVRKYTLFISMIIHPLHFSGHIYMLLGLLSLS